MADKRNSPKPDAKASAGQTLVRRTGKSEQKKLQEEATPVPAELPENIGHILDPSDYLSCVACHRGLENSTSLLLAESKEVFCVVCFLKSPKRESYKVLRPLGRIPLFSADWSCREELKLLDELEKVGFGSWHKIAKNIESKSPEDCEAHYIKFWWNHPDSLADLRRLAEEVVGTGNIDLLKTEAGADLRKQVSENFRQRRFLDDRALEESMGEGIIKRARDRAAKRVEGKYLELPGFWPLRGDFDCEYQQEAEIYLADLEFEPDDTEYELDIKKKILAEYNLKLDKRIMMKTFFIERLLNKEATEREAARNSRDDKLIRNALKSIEGYFSPEEYEAMRTNLYRKMEIRRRIEKLQSLQKQGIRTFAEIESFLGKRLPNNKLPAGKDPEAPAETVSNSRKPHELTDYEKSFVDRLKLRPEVFRDWKLQLSKAAVREGYIEQYADEKGHAQFKRSPDHMITEFFDFILEWRADQ